LAIYHKKFEFRSKTPADFNLIVSSMEANAGETDGFLGMQASFVGTYDGTKRYDYGAKFTSVATLTVTLIKDICSSSVTSENFTENEFREIAKWLSGCQNATWLNLYDNQDNIEYSFLGRFISVNPYMMDGRCVAVNGIFEATTPWALSAVQSYTVTKTDASSHIASNSNESISDENDASTYADDMANDGTTIVYDCEINNLTDDLDTYIYPTVTFSNGASKSKLTICNTTLNDITVVDNIVASEHIYMGANQIITSDNTSRIFGDDFNFVFLRLAPGENKLTITCDGIVNIQYRYYIKIAHALTDLKNT